MILLMAFVVIPLCFLQRFLCRSEKRWPGRVLPVGWGLLALAVIAATVSLTWESYTSNPAFIYQWILEIVFGALLLNLPTLIFIVVGVSTREDMARERAKREELERMKRQDLE